MNILHLGTTADQRYLPALKALLPAGCILKTVFATPTTRSEILVQLSRNKIDAIITTNPAVVSLFSGNKSATLDKYAGSLFQLGDRKVATLVMNNLEHLFTVPYGKHLAIRYLDKILAPNKFYKQSAFSWEIPDQGSYEKHLADFSTAIAIAVDIETVRTNLAISCVGYCAIYPDGSTHSIVIPADSQFNLSYIKQFNELPIPKIMQNGSYDNAYFLRYGIPPVNYLFDTLHLFHSWYSEMPKSLDFLVSYLLPDFIYWKDEAAQASSMHDYYRYNAKDTWATANCFMALMLELPDWAIKNYLIEFPIVFPCLHMAMEGFAIDAKERDKIEVIETAKLEGSLTGIRASLNKPLFNPGSPKQVKELWAVLGCKDVVTTDVKAMDKVASRHPLNAWFVTNIIGYRKAKKRLSTYMAAELLNGRFMYSFAVAGTDTGRLASRESAFWCGGNMQNIPEGIKSMFIADEGWLLADIDYAQSEARCVAYLSGDTTLIDVVESGKDYHKLNAAMFFGVPYDEVQKPLRSLAKRTNHGANYNMGAGVMVDTMGVDNVLQAKTLLKLPSYFSLHQVCQHLLDLYSKTYPVVKGKWYNLIVYSVLSKQKLVSQLGWTRFCFSDPQKSKQALNAYVAHVPQNLSVSIINQALVKVWRELALPGRIRLKAQIHDSIVFMYRPRDEAVVQLVSKMMEIPVSITGSDSVARTMLIPNDIEMGLKRWKETEHVQ
jgi:DNA polymerase I-like protein with 3'-5' exonuclease and polymerase domains